MHDLAVSKILAFRQKDRDFVRSLLIHDMVHAGTLIDRMKQTQAPDESKEQVLEWIRLSSEEL